MLPIRLVGEVEALRTEGFSVELRDAEGCANVLFSDYPLPSGYNTTSTTLLLRLPHCYPNGQPDMFWTDPGLMRVDGEPPRNADCFEKHLGRGWRRFSWHPKRWNPGIDDLRTFIEFVNEGLKRAAT